MEYIAFCCVEQLSLRAMMARGELALAEEKRPDRNRKGYNEHLVQRGEILPDVESLQGWQEELFEITRGRTGDPSAIPTA